MTQRRLTIRSRRFETEGLEAKMARRTFRNQVIKQRTRINPLVELNISNGNLNRDLKLNIGDKNASFLIGWYSGIQDPELITSPELIDRFVMSRIDGLRSRLGEGDRSRAGRNPGFNREEYAAKIEIMKNSLGLAKDENGNWNKNPTGITHTLKLPSKFGITTDHAILTIGADGLTVTPLTEQEGWAKMIAPKVYTFTVNFKPGESAMVKFGFKW